MNYCWRQNSANPNISHIIWLTRVFFQIRPGSLLFAVRGSDDSIVFVGVFFSVRMITHEPLHLFDEILQEHVCSQPHEPY